MKHVLIAAISVISLVFGGAILNDMLSSKTFLVWVFDGESFFKLVPVTCGFAVFSVLALYGLSSIITALERIFPAIGFLSVLTPVDWYQICVDVLSLCLGILVGYLVIIQWTVEPPAGSDPDVWPLYSRLLSALVTLVFGALTLRILHNTTWLRQGNVLGIPNVAALSKLGSEIERIRHELKSFDERELELASTLGLIDSLEKCTHEFRNITNVLGHDFLLIPDQERNKERLASARSRIKKAATSPVDLMGTIKELDWERKQHESANALVLASFLQDSPPPNNTNTAEEAVIDTLFPESASSTLKKLRRIKVRVAIAQSLKLHKQFTSAWLISLACIVAAVVAVLRWKLYVI